MEILRGTVGEVPWPELFATLAFAGETCELVVEAGLQLHRVAFGDHAVIAASSPVAADSALRLMMTYGTITPSMMPTIASRVAAMPSADPIEVLAEVAELSPEATLLIRRRAMAAAATRVFALVNGSYHTTAEVTLPIHPSAAIDVRALIYEGVRAHFTDEQLEAATTRHGTLFVLRPEISEDLPQFGFSPADLVLVDELRIGASLAELTSRDPGIGARGVHAIVTTLLATRGLEASETTHTSGPSSTQPPVTDPFDGTFDLLDVQPEHVGSTFELAEELSSDAGSELDTFELAEQPHSQLSTTFAAQEPAITEIPALPNAETFETFEIAEIAEPPRPVAPSAAIAPPRAFTTQPPTTGVFAARGERRTDPPPAAPAVELPPAPARRSPSGSHTALPAHPALELPPAPARRSSSGSHTALPAHPALELPPAPTPRSPSGSHTALPAHPALERPVRRPTPNPATHPQPVATPPTPQPPAAKEPSAPEVTAAQHYARGVALLDRDLPKAIVELRTAMQMSGDIDHEATLAWALFCAAPNKEAVAKTTKAVLAKAIYQSPQPALAHFYYGRMERMLGRDREALAQFKTVIEQVPRHAEALAEIRMLEARLNPRKK